MVGGRAGGGILLKKFIIASLLFFAPVTYSATTPDSEELGKAMKLDCQTFRC